MSSNHRVQDFQEPALLIADGEKCSQKLVDELLAWGPFVLIWCFNYFGMLWIYEFFRIKMIIKIS